MMRLQIPDRYSPGNPGDRLKVTEEEGTLWVWVDPSLTWPKPLVWLFSPCEDRWKWVGDLWGIDEDGDLVIVETKRIGASASEDPMADFVGTDERPYLAATRREEFTAAALREHWEKLHLQELDLPHVSHDPGGTKNIWGVLPYSNRRERLRWWPEIAETLDAVVRSKDYLNRCESYLAAREAKDNPAPHFVGLFVITAERDPRLTPGGKKNAEALIGQVGAEHVHANWVSGVCKSPTDLEVRSSSVGFKSLLKD